MDYLGPYLLGPNEQNQGIYTCDAIEGARDIPDESVGLVLCDPVYQDIDFYGFVAKESARILVPGGNCVVQLGQYHLPKVLLAMTPFLDYYWINNERLRVTSRLWEKRIFASWKPWLWFIKPGDTRVGGWFRDSVWSPPNKEYHEWGDGVDTMIPCIRNLSAELPIVDFCTGGGTVPAACKVENKKWLAFEINPESADRARQRVSQAQVPLFVLEPQQLDIEL